MSAAVVLSARIRNQREICIRSARGVNSPSIAARNVSFRTGRYIRYVLVVLHDAFALTFLCLVLLTLHVFFLSILPPLLQLMCNPDKAKRMAEDEKNAQAELDGKGARKKHPIVEAAEKAAKQLPDYISQKEMSDPVLIESVMEKIQMHTNPFAVYQYQQLKTRGFLFVQSESELKEFRHTVTQDGMDRCLVCHYMTWDEFTTYVAFGVDLSLTL